MKYKIFKLWEHPLRTPTLVGFVSLGVGGVVGYLCGVKKAYNQFSEEIEKTKIWALDLSRKEDIDRTVLEKVDYVSEKPNFKKVEVIKDITPRNDIVISAPVPFPQVEITSVHSDKTVSWDQEKEKKKRLRFPTGPYPLHKDEFFDNELDLSQITLTYYAGDDIMIDEDEKPVYNYHKITGPLNFGYGSTDENVFYVRNTDMKAEYEIVREPGSYHIEVLGVEVEEETHEKDLKHANYPGKFRSD